MNGCQRASFTNLAEIQGVFYSCSLKNHWPYSEIAEKDFPLQNKKKSVNLGPKIKWVCFISVVA